ncbi:TIGR03663 family protein [Halobacteriales archaeon SW_7_68_16]|nr:MAG: TIGR03663 family protein [Halobacteriales archaeon SW_7_68_16]
MSEDDRHRFRGGFETGRRAYRVVVAITVLALVVRFYGLGGRIMHWDEGRVGYWILRYAETGYFEYRPIIHGPFLLHINRSVFALFGASDFTARLVVALVGGLLPLAAWLLRDHLRDTELIALALVLAANPILLYYSRFMRNDVLVAGFALFAFGLFVRLVDTGSQQYLYAGVGVLALAFTTKENALLYPLCWFGATVLVIDHRLFGLRGAGTDARADGGTVRSPAPTTPDPRQYLRDGAITLYRWRWPLSVAVVEFLLLVIFFYAPRGGAADTPGLWGAMTQPTALPAVIEEALLGSWTDFVSTWGSDAHRDHAYVPYLLYFVDVLRFAAVPTVAFSILGFLADRYGSGPRDVVAIATYWGAVSLFGYPIVTDIQAAWATTHVIVPLAIPAAVGIALVYRWGREATRDRDYHTAAAVGAVLLLVAGGTAGVAADTSYLGPTADRNAERMVQWAQPGDELKPAIRTVGAVAAANEGTDVLFWGSQVGGTRFYVRDESSLRTPPAGGPSWTSRLPLPWYLERSGATVTSVSPDTNPYRLRQGAPPVVIADERDGSRLEPHLGGYRRFEGRFKMWGERVVVFVDRSYLAES